jgi:hypothetical protein
MNHLTMDLIMFPTKALLDSDPSPFFVCQQPKGTRFVGFEVFLGEHFEKLLWKYDMAILEVIIGIAIRIVNPRGMNNQLREGE